jgi:hypothetical protein
MRRMNAADHRAFAEQLLSNLAGDEDVLGLVLLGSTSGQPPAPDDFSDHDFFVVTRPGAQERFRTELGWLPGAAQVALAYRETAHGLKVLFASGHLAEFAVFDLDELALARINRYAVPLDRADVAERLERGREARRAEAAAAAPHDERWEVGQLLASLVVGAGRAARGERLSGHGRVRVDALGHLVRLLRARLAPSESARLDDLDPMRRLEQALPAVAAELDRALRLPVTAAARALLAIVSRERPELVTPAARDAVERALVRAEEAAAEPR